MWSPQPALGGALWSGNQSLATTRQLLSTSSDLTTHPELFSTTTGLRNYTTLTSNVLQTEINAIVGGGTTSLWANYRAINNVDMSGNSLNYARTLSTLDLQVSSINGTDFSINDATGNISIGGVTIVNNTITSSNVNSKTNTTSNSVITRTASAIGAVGSALTQVNQAVGGVLSNSFGALNQAYWGVAVAGQVVDLANGVVQLATGAQAMTDSRELNLISGPEGPPGQNVTVYETFNHTTQLQFSTIGTPLYTVFRTTDQQYTNQTLGREKFVSTLIPAGTKVVRSVSDPYNMPIISTQLLSTTNFIQAFGQWNAILAEDYNLRASTLSVDYIRASTISTLNLSTGAASISSINGVNINTIITPPVSLPPGIVSTPWNIGLVSTPNLSGLVSTPNLVGLVSTPNLVGLISTPNLNNLQSLTVSTGTLGADTASVRNLYVSTLYASTVITSNLVDTYIFTSSAVLSSLVITGGQLFSTLFQPSYVITGLAASTATQYTSISSLTQNIMKWTVRGTLTASNLITDLPGGTSIYGGNDGEWLGKLLMYSSIYVAPIIVYLLNADTVGDFFDFQNKSGVVGNTVTFYQGGAAFKVVQPLDANIYRFTWNGSVFVLSANPTPSGQAVNNEFTMTQGFDKTTLSTANELVIDAGNTSFTNPVNIPYGFITNIYGSNATLGVLTTAGISTNTISSGSISTNSLAVSSMGSFSFNSPPQLQNGLYDINKSYNITAATYDSISSLTNNILNYEYDMTLPVDLPVVTYPAPLGANPRVYFLWSQYGTWGGVINTWSYDPSSSGIILYLPTDAHPGTATTDIRASANIIYVIYGGGASQVTISPINTYRFTWDGSVWTYSTSAPAVPTTTFTNFNIRQNFAGVNISTSDILTVDATNIFLNAPVQASNLFATQANISTLQTAFISTGGLQVANISTGNLATTGTITANGNITTVGNIAGVNGIFTGTITGTSATTTGDINARNVISVSSITSSIYTSNTASNINQYNVKSLATPTYYNAYTSTFGINTGDPDFIPSVAIYGNALQFSAYPGLAAVGIDNGLPGGQYYYLRSDGTTTRGTVYPGTTPAFPNPWWSSIITVYNNVAGDFLLFDYVGGKGECYIQTMGTNALNYQTVGGGPSTYITPTTTPAYYKLSWNVLSNAVLNLVSGPYVPVLQTQLTGWGAGVNSNINLLAASLAYNGKKPIIFFQNVSGTLNPTKGGIVAAAQTTAVLSYNGSNFPVNRWSCYLSFYNINLAQNNLAINNFNVAAYNSGGNWAAYCYTGTATITGDGQQGINWNVQCMLVPKEFALEQSFNKYGDEFPPDDQLPPSTFISTVANFSRLPMPELLLSSITASTITVETTENMSLLANISPPGFVSTGSIYIAGTNYVNLLGNITSVGGFTDVDIDALTGNVNVVATAADINMNANSNVNITASNGNVNLTASGLIYTGPTQVWGSNIGNSLGLYRPLRFYYEPPTATGQSAEINIEAHPADAGVHFSLRYGVDLAGGYGYLLCEWPGYIVVPMKIYGQDIALEGGETIHINANSGNITLHATGVVSTDADIQMNGKNITDVVTIYPRYGGSINSLQSGGVNFLDINAASTSGSGTGQLRFFGHKGNLIFDDNVALAGNGSNYVGVYNQYGYVQLAADQNVYIGGGGGSIGGVSAINLNGLTLTRHNGSYAGGLISQITNQAASASAPGGRFGTVFIEAPNPAASGESGVQISLETSNYGGAIFGGINQGVGSFISLATNNNAGSQTERMRINGVNGYVGINTTTPYYQLDVIGDTRVAGNLYANNAVYRNLSATAVAQPILQYGTTTGSGTSGSVVVTLPVGYTTAASYVAFACMEDSVEAKIAVDRTSYISITITWSQGGTGTHTLAWNTMGG